MPTSQLSSKVDDRNKKIPKKNKPPIGGEVCSEVCIRPITSDRYKCVNYYSGICVGDKVCFEEEQVILGVDSPFITAEEHKLMNTKEPKTSFGAGAPRKGNDPVYEPYGVPVAEMNWKDDTPEPKQYFENEKALPEKENHVGYVHVPESTKVVEKNEPEMNWEDDIPDAAYPTPEPDHPSGIPDSGKRRGFITGSVREERSGKGRFDLISPIALLSVAKRLEDGMDKYSERNWEKGQPLMSYLDSAIRHIYTYLSEVMKGDEEAEDHMGAACWNIQCFIHTQEMIRVGLLPEDLDDLPTPEKVGLKYHFKPNWKPEACCRELECDCLGGLQGCDEDNSEGC